MIALSFATVLVVGVGVAQWLFAIVVGRRHGVVIEHQECDRAAIAPESSAMHRFELAFIVPCLNEAEVIGATVAALLLAHPSATVVVVDDASDDGTAALVSGLERVLVVKRRFPDARRGKGAALNAGLAALRSSDLIAENDPFEIIIGVMDADGRLSDGAVQLVLGHFSADDVGGLQLPVKIRNTDHLITRYQDFEFWGVAAGAQVARAACGSTSLGGNGQFSRMSALLEIGDAPWSDALTEDLDLAVSLMARGWRLTSTPSAFVSQQGVTSLRQLTTQRTRWMQGHMMASLRLPELWASERVTTAALIESGGYLMVPWVLVLPWSILFHLSVLVEVQFLSGRMPVPLLGSQAIARVVWLAAWYVASFAPAIGAGFTYARRSDLNRMQAVLLAHLFVAFNYVSFIAAWRALGRMILGRDGWVKTDRSAEVIDLRDQKAEQSQLELLETA